MSVSAEAASRLARREVLRQIPLFQAMRPAELEQVLDFAKEQRVRKGTVIYQKGDEGSSMAVVMTGRIRISAISLDGKEITLNVIQPGGIFGEIALMDGKPRSADATAQEETTLLVVERRSFLPFLRNNQDVVVRMIAVLCERLRSTSVALEELATLPLPARLARLLLKLSEEYGTLTADGLRIGIKLSQRDLSSLVATTRESVNKQLRAWRDEGVVGDDGGYLLISRPADLRSMIE
jgi:CRP/FNR family transcriptional regulator, cyclic AMP receptor protein